MWLSPVGLVATLTLAILVVPLIAEAQQPGKVPTIGVLATGHLMSEAERQQSPFWQALRELGWIQGQNIAVEGRAAEWHPAQLPQLAAELVQRRVDVIVVADSVAIPAAQQATRTIPIVMTISADPVENGYVASLAQPGGNITGLALMPPEIAGKRLELLTAAVPGMSRVAVLGQSDQYEWSALAVTTQALGLHLHAFHVDSPDEFELAFAAARREHADALIVLPSPLTNSHRRQIVNLAAESRLPTMYALKEYVAAGGLMAYGPHYPALLQRAAVYVDKILKGAKPADLPVERPMKYELVINLKTAQALGITLSPTLLLLADEVIK